MEPSMFLEEKQARNWLHWERNEAELSLWWHIGAEGLGRESWVYSQLSWKTNSFYLCGVIPSFLPCCLRATEFPRSVLIFLNQSPVSSSAGQPLCLPCFVCTPPSVTLPTIPSFEAGDVWALYFNLSWPLSLITSHHGPVAPFYCLLFLWAVYHKAWQFRVKACDKRLCTFLPGDSFGPREWQVVGHLPREMKIVAPYSRGHTLLFWEARKHCGFAKFFALLCHMLSLPIAIPGTLFIPWFYSKWNVKRVQMRTDRSGRWG